MDHIEQNTSSATRRSDPAALAVLALKAQRDKDVDELLERYLKSQSALADVQTEEIRHEWHLRYGSVRMRYYADILHVTFNVAIAFIAIIAAAIIGGLVWTAAHENGLVVEAFAVPPDMQARGLSGQAVASQLLDRIMDLQAASASTRPADSFSNNWGDDIKIEIPSTGVSIGEARRMMIMWLGNETHITGEVYRTDTGLAIATRASGEPGSLVTGAGTDFPALLQQAAEAVFRQTQPYRYAVYLMRQGKFPAAETVLQRLAVTGDTARERAGADLGLGMIANSRGDWYGGVTLHRRAAALFPDFALAYIDLDAEEATLAHPEASLAAARKAVQLLESGRAIDMIKRARPIALYSEQADVARHMADFSAALAAAQVGAKLPDHQSSDERARDEIVGDLAQLHDAAGALRAWHGFRPTDDPAASADRALTRFKMAYWLGQWSAILAHQDRLEHLLAAAEKNPENVGLSFDVMRARIVKPFTAVAKAMTGAVAGTQALLDQTPLDCDTCLRARGMVAAAEKRWGASDYWFERAVAFSPSIPLAYAEWGRALLARGDFHGAIAKLAVAADKAPHFADPLETWGEVLMAENRSDLALAEFEQAARFAPNWGRLHLKWGEALFYVGRKGEARAELAKASHLGLTPAERRELAGIGNG